METSALAATTGLLRRTALAARGTRALTTALWATTPSLTTPTFVLARLSNFVKN